MISNENVTEQQAGRDRRKERRYEVPATTYVGLGAACDEIGHILDISLEGLSFSYAADKKPASDIVECDLFMAGSPFYLHGLECETVWDTDTAYETQFSANNVRLRGVKFTALSDNQKAQLKYFIENHTSAVN